MDPEFVESAAVDSFVDEIRNWEMQSLVCMKNITAALEVEASRKASRIPVIVLQLREEYPEKPLDTHDACVCSSKFLGVAKTWQIFKKVQEK